LDILHIMDKLIMNSRQLEINRTICEIENIYPADNLIVTYKDFLKHRDFLCYYQYNSKVFYSLVYLTLKLWNTEKRISRQSLVHQTKRYFSKSENRNNIPKEIKSKLFELFRQIVVFENLKLNNRSLEYLKNSTNNLLIEIKLSNDQIRFLFDNVNKSNHVLNRILRYPEKSKIISSWARENFENDLFRHRRAEMAGWIIDENPAFEIDVETLKFDFEYLNIQDTKSFEKYEDELSYYNLIQDEVNPIFEGDGGDIFESKRKYEYSITKPELKLNKRFYGSAIVEDYETREIKLNIERLKESFYSNIENIYKVSMAWSIAYSRLTNKQKTVLLKKYYSPDIYYTYLRIGKKMKNVSLLEWLKSVS